MKAKKSVLECAYLMIVGDSDEAARRMKELYASEDVLWGLGTENEIPQELRDWIEMNKYEESCPCRFYSDHARHHEECKQAMNRWFTVNEILYSYCIRSGI